MSKLLIISRFVVISIVLVCIFSGKAHAHVHKLMEKSYKAPVVKLSDETLKRRLENISSEVDYEITSEVKRRIKEYTVSYPESSEKILGRVMLYFPIFDREISQRGLPDELKYVAVVESLLRPEGTSRSGAAGLWQILRSTGRWLGLEVNSIVDERRDPEKSTVAALEYLEYLYEQFGDWTLAIAAYNCGPGNMRKAIRRGGSKNYWELRSHLPAETQDYIPRVVAAAYLMNYYHLHNLEPNVPNQDMRYITKISVDKEIRFRDIEKELELTSGTLLKLNPSFVNGRTAKTSNLNQVYIPTSKHMEFLQRFQPEAFRLLLDEQRKLEEQKKRELIEQTALLRRDSIRSIEKIVVNFIDILTPNNKREYNIPNAMRSNLSYLRA